MSNSVNLDFALVAEVTPPRGTSDPELQALTRFLLAAEGAAGDWEITIVLVDDPRLQALHRDFMGSDSPTDIMTFPLEVPGAEVQGGDLVISVDHALSQAAGWGHSPVEELRFLVAHGLLHLLGWRDDTLEQREAMLERQRQLIEQWQSQLR